MVKAGLRASPARASDRASGSRPRRASRPRVSAAPRAVRPCARRCDCPRPPGWRNRAGHRRASSIRPSRCVRPARERMWVAMEGVIAARDERVNLPRSRRMRSIARYHNRREGTATSAGPLPHPNGPGRLAFGRTDPDDTTVCAQSAGGSTPKRFRQPPAADANRLVELIHRKTDGALWLAAFYH